MFFLQGILNKLTPDNYDRLKQKIEEVQMVHQKVRAGICRMRHCNEGTLNPIMTTAYVILPLQSG